MFYIMYLFLFFQNVLVIYKIWNIILLWFHIWDGWWSEGILCCLSFSCGAICLFHLNQSCKQSICSQFFSASTVRPEHKSINGLWYEKFISWLVMAFFKALSSEYWDNHATCKHACSKVFKHIPSKPINLCLSSKCLSFKPKQIVI